MAALQIISLDTTTPRLRAPGSGDTYSAPRAMDIAPETLTGSAATSSLSIAQTWNTTGAPSALLIDVTNTASNSASYLINARLGGTSIFRVRRDGYAQTAANAGIAAISGSIMRFYDGNGNDMMQLDGTNPVQVRGIGIGTSPATSNADVFLVRDAANTLAQRNGVNAQAFNIYNTFTDASNYERGVMAWSSNALTIGTEAIGTGSLRNLFLAGVQVVLRSNGTNRWQVDVNGHLTASVDNTYDIGASGANRPRNIWLGSGVITGNSGTVAFGNRAAVSAPNTNIVRISNDSVTAGATLELVEMTAPTAPGTNNVRIYAEDNGSGKTRLMALFATGAAQQIAIEP